MEAPILKPKPTPLFITLADTLRLFIASLWFPLAMFLFGPGRALLATMGSWLLPLLLIPLIILELGDAILAFIKLFKADNSTIVEAEHAFSNTAKGALAGIAMIGSLVGFAVSPFLFIAALGLTALTTLTKLFTHTYQAYHATDAEQKKRLYDHAKDNLKSFLMFAMIAFAVIAFNFMTLGTGSLIAIATIAAATIMMKTWPALNTQFSLLIDKLDGKNFKNPIAKSLAYTTKLFLLWLRSPFWLMTKIGAGIAYSGKWILSKIKNNDGYQPVATSAEKKPVIITQGFYDRLYFPDADTLNDALDNKMGILQRKEALKDKDKMLALQIGKERLNDKNTTYQNEEAFELFFKARVLQELKKQEPDITTPEKEEQRYKKFTSHTKASFFRERAETQQLLREVYKLKMSQPA